MVSKPCEHSGIACRPAKCAGTCDFSSLALLFGQVLFGNIYAFFWQNVAIYVLFCKNIDIDAIFWQNVAIYALFSRFRPNSQKLFPVPPLSFYQPCKRCQTPQFLEQSHWQVTPGVEGVILVSTPAKPLAEFATNRRR